MGMRRAQHMAERHPRQHHVVDIAAAAPQQPRILEPRHRLPQRKFTHAKFSRCQSSSKRVYDHNPLDLLAVAHVF